MHAPAVAVAEPPGYLGHPPTAVAHVKAEGDARSGLFGSQTLGLPEHRRGRCLGARFHGQSRGRRRSRIRCEWALLWGLFRERPSGRQAASQHTPVGYC